MATPLRIAQTSRASRHRRRRVHHGGLWRRRFSPRSGAAFPAAESPLQATLTAGAKRNRAESRKPIAGLKSEVTALNTRMNDMNTRTGETNTWLAEFTILIAVGGAIVGFLVLQVSERKARKAAEAWLARNGDGPRLKSNAFQAKDPYEIDGRNAHALASPAQNAFDAEAARKPERSVTAPSSPAAQPASDEDVSKELLSQSLTLSRLNRLEEASTVYDTIVARFGNANASAIRERVAKALFSKGIALGKLNRPEEAIEAYDTLIAHFEGSSDPALRERVAKALFNKGATLGQLNRLEEAMDAYETLIGQFGGATEPAIQEVVAKATADMNMAQGAEQKPFVGLASLINRVERSGVFQSRQIADLVQLQIPRTRNTPHDFQIACFWEFIHKENRLRP